MIKREGVKISHTTIHAIHTSKNWWEAFKHERGPLLPATGTLKKVSKQNPHLHRNCEICVCFLSFAVYINYIMFQVDTPAIPEPEPSLTRHGLKLEVFGFSHNQNNCGLLGPYVTCMYCVQSMQTNIRKTSLVACRS